MFLKTEKGLFFLGKLGKDKLNLPKPKANHLKISIKDAIYDLPFICSGEGQEISDYDKKYIESKRRYSDYGQR